MTKDLIRYDLLVQDACKGVLRKVLGDVAKDGLPGDHHFYISFRTDFPGVRISPRLREKYPQDMTIVLQHQFWDLSVTEHVLEVGLSFSGVPERLSIPLDALTGFFDPSVQFGLKFEIDDKSPGAAAEASEQAAKPPVPIAEVPVRKPGVPAATRTAPKLPAKPSKAAQDSDKAAAKGDSPERSAKGPKRDADKADETGAEVVSLDAFRKKS
jgi:uncharacterized protein